MALRPLVSVLIRTMGRATLARSIGAVVSQSHRPIEIVVVNAAGKPLPALPATGDVSMRVVEGGPYDRPRAANAGLDNAKGEWLVFLDDDDAFAPNHIETLLGAIERSEGARVAYSASAVVEPDGRMRTIIGAEFNRLHLFIGNYMQIGAVLFSRSLMSEGARFDEGIACFEDWDFIIQLAQLTRFAYTGRPTNFWCAYAGESGAGFGANKREDATRPFHEKVVAKWAERAHALNGELERNPADAERITRGDPTQGMVQGN